MASVEVHSLLLMVRKENINKRIQENFYKIPEKAQVVAPKIV